MNNNTNIIIVKVYSTSNEVSGVSVKKYPTLKHFPGNDKSKPLDFDDEVTTEKILKFFKEKTI